MCKLFNLFVCRRKFRNVFFGLQQWASCINHPKTCMYDLHLISCSIFHFDKCGWNAAV